MKKLIILLVFAGVLYADYPDGKIILEKIDANFVSENRTSVVTMVVNGRRGTRTIKSKLWIERAENAFIECLSPEREAGTKMLKLKKELWIWNPSNKRTIEIAGSMLRQPMMGADISYEDVMEDLALSDLYDSKIIGEEDINGYHCYIMDLVAKQDNIAYPSRKLWVDKESYLPIKEELFAKSGKLLKTIEIQEISKIETRYYPRRIVFKNVLQEGSRTEITLDSVRFNVEIPEYIFSKESLRK